MDKAEQERGLETEKDFSGPHEPFEPSVAGTQAPPPFDCTGVTGFVFQLSTRAEPLRMLCNRFLNFAPPDELFFEPYIFPNGTCLVMMQILHYGSLMDGIIYGSQFLRQVTQQELLFAVPVKRFEQGQLIEIGLFIPYIYVDKQASMLVGREVVGLPKLFSRFSSVRRFPSNGFTLSAQIRDSEPFKPMVIIDPGAMLPPPFADSKVAPFFGPLEAFRKGSSFEMIQKMFSDSRYPGFSTRILTDPAHPGQDVYRSILRCIYHSSDLTSEALPFRSIITLPPLTPPGIEGKLGLIRNGDNEIVADSGSSIRLDFTQGEMATLWEAETDGTPRESRRRKVLSLRAMRPANLLIYGATGYSGRLIVQRALARGLRPVIAGRDPRAVKSMAAECGLEGITASADDPAALRALASSCTVLLNAAGPFTATSASVIDACIATGTHYLYISAEAGNIEATAHWHDKAARCGVMLMPAVGFEVVASDCLAAHVARRLPGATTLKIGFDKSDATSRGSLKNTLEMSGQGVLVRRESKLMRVAPGKLVSYFDYGEGPQESLAVSLGDTSTAFFSTGIPNIETYLRASLPVWSAITVDQYWGWLPSAPPLQTLMKAQLDWLVPDPTPEDRSKGWAVLVAEVRDGFGRHARARMQTGDVYWYTAQSSVAVAERCLTGEFTPGFQTPAKVYGPDFALSFCAASREDL